ncbi:hypothetical protein [Thalassospira sp.]|uniref:DUF4376 domain-containing protein n=1 Tax=Thalassospira sp. TaxID=1912094 RepID=UPI003AA940C4
MPWASDDAISQNRIDGGIEITEAEYAAFRRAMIAGETVAIRGGEVRMLVAAQRTVFDTATCAAMQIAANDDTPDGYTDLVPGSPADIWGGMAWVAAAPGDADVNIERDRRQYPGALATGMGWDVDLRHDQDRQNIQAKFSVALKRKISGNNDPILFKGADNISRELTPDEMIAVGDASDAWITAVYAASWQIKAMADGVPDDFADDRYWP